MKTMRIAVSATAVCLALGACAQGGAGPTQPGGAPVSTSPAQPSPTEPADPALPMPTRPAKPTPPGSTSSAPMSVTGTVSAGVEPNCLLLDGYLLVGGPRELLRPGARVTVTGRVQPDLMTTCQQGTPLLVESARPG